MFLFAAATKSPYLLISDGYSTFISPEEEEEEKKLWQDGDTLTLVSATLHDRQMIVIFNKEDT